MLAHRWCSRSASFAIYTSKSLGTGICEAMDTYESFVIIAGDFLTGVI
jgi:hypothetical protein